MSKQSKSRAVADRAPHPIDDPHVYELCQMLQYRRPAGSSSEQAFIERWIDPLGVGVDAYGNRFKRIGDAPVLWSSHTDSVHSTDGPQRVSIDQTGTIGLQAGETSSCLGADCATGVWLMRHMILAGVEGLYIFHRAEELGGLGSRHIAQETPELLDGVRYAIAFDRRGYDSIITHQGSRCASNAFALSLAPHLPKGFAPDDTGLLTDTANYDHLIPECSNLSVGYHDAHSPDETQDALFALRLLESIKRLDISSLVCERDPLAQESEDASWVDYLHGSNWLDDVGRKRSRKPRARLFDSELMDMAELCEQRPFAVAEALLRLGMTLEDLEEGLGL